VGKGGRNIAEETRWPYLWLCHRSGHDAPRPAARSARQGPPWSTGKNVEQSSPLGLIHPQSETGVLETGRIKLTVNGETKQDADLADLIWDVKEVIAYVSRFYRLEPGDLIYTGTPAGVGAVVTGDEIMISIDGSPTAPSPLVRWPMTEPLLHGFWRSSASYRVRMALALKGIDYTVPFTACAKASSARGLSGAQPARAGARAGNRRRGVDAESGHHASISTRPAMPRSLLPADPLCAPACARSPGHRHATPIRSRI
jgi:hypothetical protein